MKEAVLLSNNDIKAILAKHFDVPEDNIIQTKYSFIVIEGKMEFIQHEVQTPVETPAEE